MKKFIAIILSITLLFSFMAIPVSAELGDSSTPTVSTGTIKSVFERLSDVFHNLIANIFKAFGQDCPLCENHDGYGEAGGEGDYNYAEVAAKYNEAVNALKAHKKTLKIEHISNINYELQDASGVSESVRKAIKDFFEDYKGKNHNLYEFKRSESAKISALIPPSGKAAALNAAYLNFISCYFVNDKTKIEFELMDSKSSFDGTTTTNPEGYADVLDPINLAEYDFGSGKIKKADIAYKNTTVEATMNSYNQVENLKTSSEITFDVTFELNGKTSQFTIVVDCANEYQMSY